MISTPDLDELLKIAQPIDRVRSRLDALGRRHSARRAQCPAHDDARESLALDTGDDGRALVNCHAGCDYQDVLAALGVPASALFARGKRGPAVDLAARRRELEAAERAERLMANGALLALLQEQEGYTSQGLRALGVGQTERGLNFTERDARGRAVGLLTYVPPTFRSTVPGPPKALERGGARGMIYGALDAEMIVVTEGAPATLAAASCGFSVLGVASASYAPTKSAGRLVRGRNVVIFCDADPSGRAAAGRSRRWALESGAEGAAIVDLWPDRHDGRDIADELRERGRAHTVDLLMSAIARATFDLPNRTRGRPATELQAAIKYLATVLGDGELHAVHDVLESRPSNVSERTMKRARKELNVDATKIGSAWFLKLREQH